MKRFVVVEIDAEDETCGRCPWEYGLEDLADGLCLLYNEIINSSIRCNRCIAAESAVAAFKAVLDEIGA